MLRRAAGRSGIVWNEAFPPRLRGWHGVDAALGEYEAGMAPALGRLYGCAVQRAECRGWRVGPIPAYVVVGVRGPQTIKRVQEAGHSGKQGF